MDALATLGYYGLTDPLQWLGALFTGKALEFYYHFLIFFYIYITGALFCVYVRKYIVPNANSWFIALSGLIYTTSGYQTIGIIKNPYYAAGGIYLVLLLIAVERVFHERKWIMMSLTTLLMLMSNFYLAYKTTLLVVLYIMIRLVFRIKKIGFKKSVGDGFVLLGSYLLGLALSMVFLLPSAINFVASGRVDVTSGYTDSLLHYPWAYYLKLAMLFCAPYDYAGYWALQSFCPLALFSVLVLFMPKANQTNLLRDESRNQIRACFLVLLICLCVPVAGKIFNGLGYVTNRWSYGYAVVVSTITAWALPRMFAPEFEGRKKLAIFGLVWAGLMLLYGVIAHKIPIFEGGSNVTAVSDYGIGTKNVAALAGAFALGATAVCLLILDKRIKVHYQSAVRIIAGLTTLCCFGYSIGYALVAATSGEFKKNDITFQIENQTAAAAREIEDDSFYRVDVGNGTNNQVALLDYYGTSYYWSMIPEWVTSHYTDLQLSTQRWTFRLDGMGADTYLDALASVKYCLRPASEISSSLPYGYSLVNEVQQQDGDLISVYENQYALPLGYVFDAVMSEEEYAQLDPIAKRLSLMSCAVLGDGDYELEQYVPAVEVEELEWKVSSVDGVVLNGNELLGQQGGTITFTFESRPDAEIYLHLDNVELLSVNDDTDLRIDCLTESGTNRMYIILPGGNFNYDQQGVCMRLGYDEDGLTECTLKFAAAGRIRFDQMRVLSVPMEYYRTSIESIKDRGVWNAQPQGDYIQGEIDLQEPGIMQISIPFSTGWKACVDGEEAKIVHCGGMYMGIYLEAGAHQVEMRYETPGLRLGACITFGGVLVLAFLGYRNRRCRRKMNSK